MRSIYRNHLGYRLVKSYIAWALKHFYSEILILGKENIPVSPTPLIFAANHLNALMDNLLMVTLPPTHKPRVFMARSDLFSLPQPFPWLLRFAKMLPAYRMRDGFEQLNKNNDSFSEAIDVLMNKGCLVIMPEGGQGEEKKIRPLVKGIFRIAFKAQTALAEGESVCIVPVGIDMEDLIKFGKRLIINVGTPIYVQEYISELTENPVKAINSIRDRLSFELKQLVPHYDTTQYLRTYETVVEVCRKKWLEQQHLTLSTENAYHAERNIVRTLTLAEGQELQKMNQLSDVCHEYVHLLKTVSLTPAQWPDKTPTLATLMRSCLKALWLNLLGLPGYVFHSIPFLSAYIIPKVCRVSYTGFYSSIYFAAGLFLIPLSYVGQSIVMLHLLSLPFYGIILLIPLQFFCGKWSLLAYNQSVSTLAKLRYYVASIKFPEQLKAIQQLQQAIQTTFFHFSATFSKEQ